MNRETVNLLTIEDSPEDAVVYRRLLGKDAATDYRLFEVSTAADGLQFLRSRKIDCILLDYNLPDMDGLEFLTEIAADERIADIPTIVLTGQGNEMIAVQAMKSGATDYLVKGALNKELLVRTIRHAIEKKQTERELQQTTEKLKSNLRELEKANQRIIEQQKSLIEEERLKVLLQMAGATAHELNQPLMVLLGNIQLLEMDRQNPEKITQYISKIQQAGDRIADIINKIKTIRQHEVKPYAGESSILEIDQTLNILSVEDEEEDFHRLRELLKDDPNIHLLRAMDHGDAFQVIESDNIHLIFLDYVLPSGIGIDFLMELDHRGKDIPVVVITGRGDEVLAARTIQAGAYDYLPKSKLSKKSLSRIIQNVLEKYRLKSEVKEAMKKVTELESRDELTGLYNRKRFMEIIEEETAEPEKGEKPIALCLIDLDHFKSINEIYGHQAGDAVLKAVAQALKSGLQPPAVACRYSGEELAVLFPDTTRSDAISTCDAIRQRLEVLPVEHKGKSIHIKASIGVVTFEDTSAAAPEAIVELAGSALLTAKKQGGNRTVATNG